MQLKNYFSILACLLVGGFSLQGQVFFTEDFSGGAIPAGWTNVDLTSSAGEEVTFVWSSDPAAVAPAALGNTATATFLAAGSSDGYLWANSDRGLAAAPATNHTTELTTAAIDCSAAADVFFSMNSLIGVFELDANVNAILRVSTDNATWTDFEMFPNLTTGVRWSDNPFLVSVDISAIASNESEVYLQIQWLGGWEYFMAIDDIQLTTEDPRPAANLRVNDFAAIAPNAWTPMDQVEPIGFIADIENVGSEDQTNTVLTMEITDGATVVFTDEIAYGDIASDQLLENTFFDNQFDVPAMEAVYTATYSLSYDNVANQDDATLNEYSFPVIVTERMFSKDNGFTRAVAPAADNSYTYGNVYYMNNDQNAAGEDLLAHNITFGMSNSEDLAGLSAVILLLEWDGDANESFSAEQDEYTIYGFNSYEFTGTEGDELITVPVSEDGALPITAGKYYIAAIQFESDDPDADFFLQASDEFDYQAMNFYTDSLEMPRYAAALDVGNEGTMGMTGFGLDLVPIVRLEVGTEIGVNTEEIVLPEGSVKVFPNPANNYANLSFDLTEETAGQLSVYDAKGSLVSALNLGNISQDQIRLDTKDLPNGTYFLRIDTELGVRSLQLNVQH